MREELLKGLTEEQIARVKACKNQEEILKLAKEEGIELTDDQIVAVSGGGCNSIHCPRCGSTNIRSIPLDKKCLMTQICRNCHYTF